MAKQQEVTQLCFENKWFQFNQTFFIYKIVKILTEQLKTNSGDVDLNFVFQTRATPSGSSGESSYDAKRSSGNFFLMKYRHF